jgi:hypothetical protein
MQSPPTLITVHRPRWRTFDQWTFLSVKRCHEIIGRTLGVSQNVSTVADTRETEGCNG